jgi:membrane carboxypeptidase/penicillin-binding protein PbpC
MMRMTRRTVRARRIVLLLAVLLAIAAPAGLRLVPIPAALLHAPVQSIALVDRSGTPLRESRVEDRFSREITLAEVPQHVIHAVLAAEEDRKSVV